MSVTNSALAQQIADLIQSTEARDAKLRGWIGGSAIGGPNNDGRYPLIDAIGQEHLLPSPARLTDMVTGPAAAAAAARDQALTAKNAVDLAATQTENNRALSQAARGAAIDARNLAQEYRNYAGTHEANARYWAELAQSKGEGTTEDRAVVEQLAGEVVIHASEVAQDASDAAASAALAATFDPSLYDKKSDTVSASRLTGVIDIARIPVLPSQLQFVSSGGLANLTPAQQNDIGRGSIVTTTDGFRYVYSGSGSKTVASSYTILADITPAWDSVSDKPSFYPSNIASVAGLQSALDGLAPKSNATFSTAISVNGAVGAHSYAFNTGLLYPDGNHTVIKTGASGAERYWRFDANGFFYALNGGGFFNGGVDAHSFYVGTGAKSAQVLPGWIELRNNDYGPYIDFSKDGTTDFHGRVAYRVGDNRFQFEANGGNLHIGPGGAVNAVSSDGSQDGRVITVGGSDQTVLKNVGFQNAGEWEFNASPSTGLEVQARVSGGAAGAAMMRFHRPGAFGVMFGLGTDNRLRVGGWSRGTASFRVLSEDWSPLSVESASGNLLIRDGDGWASAHGFRSQPGDGNGVRFWQNNNDYSIHMASSAWGGRIWEGTSDYNMYFKMTGGTNRGFNFKNGNNVVAGIDGGGTLRLNGSLEAAGEVYCSNWFRVRGASQGIYWEQFGGGWQMTDSSYLRAYNDKHIYTGGFIQANNIKLGYGVDVGIYSDVNNMAYRTPHASGTHFFQSNGGSKTYCIMGDGSINMYRSMWMNGGLITFNSRGLNNGLRFQQNSERDLRFIQKAENWLHWTNETDGYEIAGLDCFGNFNTRSSITSPSVTATSDRSLKQAIQTFDNALTILAAIRPVRFEWKSDGRSDIGVIAQEFEAIVPELVRTGGDGVKSVNYNGLTVINTGAIQEMASTLNDLREEIRQIKGRLH